jgi:hypothetical protein
MVSTLNLSHIAPLSTAWAGDARNRHLGAPALGLPHEATSVVAFAFLAAGVLDALVMLAWERLFPV